MPDLQIFRDRITGLEESLKAHQDKKEIFNKAQGLAEEKEKLLSEAEKTRASIETAKETHKGLVEKKNAAVRAVLQKVQVSMDTVLPRGRSILRIDEDGGFYIGWQDQKDPVPYSGLSGGEKVAFDQALARALGATVLIVEAAEMDPTRLAEAMDRYGKTGLQVIVSSCHEPTAYPGGWKAVRL